MLSQIAELIHSPRERAVSQNLSISGPPPRALAGPALSPRSNATLPSLSSHQRPQRSRLDRERAHRVRQSLSIRRPHPSRFATRTASVPLNRAASRVCSARRWSFHRSRSPTKRRPFTNPPSASPRRRFVDDLERARRRPNLNFCRRSVSSDTDTHTPRDAVSRSRATSRSRGRYSFR